MKQPRIGLLVLGDLVCIGVAFIATLMFGFGGSVPAETWLLHAKPFAILYVVWILIFYIFELYDIEYHRHGIQLYAKIGQALLSALLISIAFFYLLPIFGITPRTNLAINLAVFGIFFLLWRIIFSNHLARKFHIKTTILDPQGRLDALSALIAKNPQLGLGKPDRITNPAEIASGFIIIDSQHTPHNIIESILKQPIVVIDAISAYEQYFQKIPVDLIDTKWILHRIQKNRNVLYGAVRFVLDRMVAILVLILTLPITALTALAIYLEDRGPIFYTQTRTGHYGKPFPLYKFRSMSINAEKNGAEWSSGDQDPRVTKVGRIIRKLHIDEIPQMLNILRGDIALIGPRAERPEFVSKLEQEIPHYRLRHIIKPGFTGWAQVKFFYARSVMDSLEKFQYDLYYIKNRNLIIDLAILARTAHIIVKH